MATHPVRLGHQPSSAASSPTASPPPRSRHSTRSFTSLSPSDSRSNYRPPKQRLTSSIHHPHQSRVTPKQAPSHPDPSDPYFSLTARTPFPIGTRPQDLDISSIDDPDDLFVNFTIREIRTIEQRARADADQKREDLRQMVGERYRDLLGAADSIVRMKLSAESLLDKLGQAQSESDRTLLKSRATAAGNSHKRSTTGSSKLSYVLATLVRLLLDLSEHVWRSLEREDFLTASRYVSLGRIISNELTTGNWDERGETEPSEVVEMFPIVERQSETLGQLGPQISSKAKLFLRKWDVKNQGTLEALAAITLLDNTTLLDSLQLLLQVRKTVFRTFIASLGGSWTEHIKSAVKLLVATLINVQQIFIRNDFVDLLKAIQDGSSKEMHLKPLFSLLPNLHQLMRYIPRSILDFSPFVAALAASREELEPVPTTQSWFETCQTDLISYIDQKLVQVETAESLVKFRQQLHQAIGQLNGEFESTIKSFEAKLIISLDRRFYELYQSRLEKLQDEIVESLDPQRTMPKPNKDERENWILNKKLPLLEPNNPTKYAKYLNSIQNRIEGKLILKEDGERNSSTNSDDSIVSKIELVGQLLKEDFKKWENGGDDSLTQRTAAAKEKGQVQVYVNLGNQFVENCLKKINQVLHQQVEQSNIEQELNVGNLALQILSTRNSFMMDLSLVNQNNEQNQDGNELIQKFEKGLSHIIFDSTRHWSRSIVDKSVRLFNSSWSKLVSNNHSLNSEGKEERFPTKPSDPIFQSLNLISNSMVTSLGVHRLKLQQADLLNMLMDEFILNILDDRFVNLAVQSAKCPSHDSHAPRWEAILFDLLLLLELVLDQNQFNHSSSRRENCSRQVESKDGLKKLRELVELFPAQSVEDEQNDKVKIIKENVKRFKSTVARLWWPLTLINEPETEDEQKKSSQNEKPDHSKLLFGEIKDPSQLGNLTTTPNKLAKFGGLACVKPGNRFALLSVF